MEREDLEKFISRPEPEKRRELPKEAVTDFHRYGVMVELGQTYQLIDEKKIWPNGPFARIGASVRVIKGKEPPSYIEPHIEDHDQIQIFVGEPTRPDSLTAEITLEDQKFEVKTPFVAMYPKGLKHSERVVSGSGWLLTIHLAKHCLYYGPSLKPSPVEVGKEYVVNIKEMSREGQGIARIKDFPIFVPNTKLGDHVKVKISRISQLAADAEIVK